MAVKWMMVGGFLALVVTWQQVEGRPPREEAPASAPSSEEATKCPRVIPREIDVVCKDIEDGGRFTEMLCIDRFRNTFKLIRPNGPQVTE